MPCGTFDPCCAGFCFPAVHYAGASCANFYPQSSAGRSSGFLCARNARTSVSSFQRSPFSRPVRTRTRSRFFASVDIASPGSADVAVLLLAGGVGSRMKADRPKQFLELRGRTVLEHSLELFCSLPEVSTVVIVVDESYRGMVEKRAASAVASARSMRRDVPPVRVVFADPGVERQDSVRSGLRAAEAACTGSSLSLVAVHDSARPLVSASEVRAVIADARAHGAAVLGVPCKATVKESADGRFVLRTVPRERLWEVHTPQVIRPELLRRGFEYVDENNLAVTDDVSIVEQLGEPVRLTKGEYTNIKITTPEDLDIAESILAQRAVTTSPL